MRKADSNISFLPDSDEGVVKASPPPIHWTEKVVLFLLSLHLVFLPWALGTMHLWSQWTSLGLAGITFLAAVLLNPPSTTIVPKPPAWRKLAASRVFWLGLAVLGYILIQALNPAYRAVDVGGEYWMVPVEYMQWLPSGMEAPFEKINAFRRLMVFGSTFLTIWTICLFLERPKSIRFLLWVLTFNGIGLAILAFAQLFTAADLIFWRVPSSNQTFYASFIYRNHATAYLNLLLAVSTGLYFYFRERAWKTNRKADKSPIFFFTSTILFTTVLFSTSRGGIMIAALILLVAIIYTLIQAWSWNRLRETSVISTVLLGMLILFASVFTAAVGPEPIIERFRQFTQEGGGSAVEGRLEASKATADMFRDNWLFGTGAGSFEYAFPEYQQHYPSIYFTENPRYPERRTYWVWEFAHNDWLQYLAEYGVVGSGLFLLGIFGWLITLWRHHARRNPVAVWLALGVLLTLAHGLGDFVLQNPAIIITAAAAMALSLRATVLEDSRRRRKS